MKNPQRVWLQPAYLLHHRPFRDTSEILELFTPDYGRIAVVAKGARSAKSKFRGVLQLFSPLLVSWSLRSELGTLTGVDQASRPFHLDGEKLLSGFYLNELLLRLIQKHDPHRDIFEDYETALGRLAAEDTAEPALRIFEKRMLQALGYGLNLLHDIVTGEPVVAGRRYEFRLEEGPVAIKEGSVSSHIYEGSSLIALGREELADTQSLEEAKSLLRSALALYLGPQPLKSRQVLKALRAATRPVSRK